MDLVDLLIIMAFKNFVFVLKSVDPFVVVVKQKILGFPVM